VLFEGWGISVKKIAVALTALVLMSASTQAADLILDTPEVEYGGAFHDWSGFYAGVVGGYGFGSGVATNAVSGTTGTTAASGALVGLNAGFNHQMDNFVLGAEGEIMWSGVRGTEPCDNFVATCTADLLWLGSIRARAGVALDSWLLYGTAGVAAGGLNTTFSPAAPVTGAFSGTALGWTAGLGAEVKVADNISLKGEYAYYALGPVRAPVGTLSATDGVDVSGNLHTVKVGVNFKF
jgi:outer membrane immunogenic protein